MTRQQTAPTMNGDTRTKPVLLIADPDGSVVDALAAALEREGVAVTGAPDGAQGLLQAGALQPDVVLVAATLPVIDAVDFVRAVRLARAVPVLLGVGEGHAEQAVRALAAGAAACVARPYRVPELLPFIQAASPESRKVLAVGGVELDVQAYQVRVGGRTVHLPLREFELLQYLMRNADRTVTREQIMRHVWNATATTSTNTIAVHVKRLRARLGDEDDQLIQTVRGVGYRLVTPSISGNPA
ncbi:response regulator transcription factor [Nonomuraea sp. KC401]|uniref:Response regulator transcription factor n=1 Tax=Nonomuraea longispora TaxID=1848320 RepID=A0A4R4N776_9ACTN|nr:MULTISPECIES: response regulator transcription factor [Nonomuraea]NBE98475.1 response regulator [Nonomuraea sp. K271]TDC03123.1 response regulator transcription factor [Nonomuraea longispora]TLF83226.1 response regulator transcription factor [Nonomuraea sp. KC401]